MSDIEVIVTESLIEVFTPSDVPVGFVIISGTFPDGSAQTLDTVLGPNASWNVDFVDGSGNYLTEQVEGRSNGITADWRETGIVTNIVGVPVPVVAVNLSGANLALVVTAALGWSWRVRRSSWT